MCDDALPVQIDLGIDLSAGLTVAQLVRRIAMCSSVAAAGQPSMRFLEDEATLLDARILEVDGKLVAERSAPVNVRDPELFPRRRRGLADALLLRAATERDELQDEVVAAAMTSEQTLQHVGRAMNTEPAERLAARYEQLERELSARTLPARRFIAAKQKLFDLVVGDHAPVRFDPPAVRTRVAANLAMCLTVAPLPPSRRDGEMELAALVLSRAPVPGRSPSELPQGMLELEHSYPFRFEGLTEWQLVTLAAAQVLSAIIRLEAKPVVSPVTLEARPTEVVVVSNWEELRSAVLNVLLASPSSPN